VLAVVFFHDALVAEAQVHFGSVRSTYRVVIVRALGLTFTGWRNRRRRAGGLQLVAGAYFLVTGRTSIY